MIFVCGFGCVALVRSGPLLGSLFYSFTIGLLLIAALLAMATRGSARFFWLGFAVAGSAYLWVAREPTNNYGNNPLVTTRILQWGLSRIPAQQPVAVYPSAVPPGYSTVPYAPGAPSTQSPPGAFNPYTLPSPAVSVAPLIVLPVTVASPFDYDAFMLSGHCLFALLLAWIAGHFTRFVHARSRLANPSST
jgi:hypothetical protein